MPSPSPAATAVATPATAPPAVPGDLRPDKPVAPLVSVPLGRGAGAGASAGADGDKVAGTMDDTMARCKALKAGTAREDCLRKARITSPKP